MQLKELLHAIPVKEYRGLLETEVSSLCLDSRKMEKDGMFIAVRGHQTDGHHFIPQAIENGALVIVLEEIPELINENITYVLVDDSAYALGVIASNFYGNPSTNLKLVGVTGTNGKTTVATLLFNLFTKLGYKVGLISTVQNQIGEQILPSTHTTPNPISLNFLLKLMQEAGCDYCFIEVSSHAIVQQRIAGLVFAGGIFTNLTHDHLDFHENFLNYLNAKKKFFDDLSRNAFALTNTDDRNGQIMLQNTFAHRKTYGLRQMADFKCKILENHLDGMLLQVENQEVWVKLVGEFNAYNLTAVYGTAILLEQETVKVLTALSEITGAKGRFEILKANNGVTAIVDYAHTPDAVENILKTINQFKKQGNKILTVLGCGGDRDKTKRPEMAAVATNLSDKVIFTSDNPRSEDPLTIIREMEAGVPADKRKNVFSISDRKEAIRAAFHLANDGDIMLVAGKGHENYQEINGVRNHFDDKEELTKIFNEYI